MIPYIVASGLVLLLVAFIIVLVGCLFVQQRRKKLSVTLNQGMLRY